MTVRVVLVFVFSFVMAQALIYGHYLWSSSLLHINLVESDFNATEPTAARIGFLPIDHYRVVFRFEDGFGQDRQERSLVARKLLQEGRVAVEIRVTGFLGREVLEYSNANISFSRDWSYSSMGLGPQGLWGPAEFRALPLERYTVAARLSGKNPLLENQTIALGLKAARDNGYHGIGHIVMHYLVGALFVLAALFGASFWIFIKLEPYVQRRR